MRCPWLKFGLRCCTSALLEPEFRWCVLKLCISAQRNIWHKLHHIHRPSSLLVSPILTVCCLSCWPSTKPEMMSNAGTLLYHMLLGLNFGALSLCCAAGGPWREYRSIAMDWTLSPQILYICILYRWQCFYLYELKRGCRCVNPCWTTSSSCSSTLNLTWIMDCITCPVYSFQNQDLYPHGMLTMIMYGIWTRLLFGILLTFGRLCTNLYKRSDWHYAMMQPVLYGILGTKHPAHV